VGAGGAPGHCQQQASAASAMNASNRRFDSSPRISFINTSHDPLGIYLYNPADHARG
jgi:hypothetical protein